MSEWQPMATAPRDATDILVATNRRANCNGLLIVHWAHGGGEEQPPFGPAWFFWTGFDFRDLGGEPLCWMPLPKPPETR